LGQACCARELAACVRADIAGRTDDSTAAAVAGIRKRVDTIFAADSSGAWSGRSIDARIRQHCRVRAVDAGVCRQCPVGREAVRQGVGEAAIAVAPVGRGRAIQRAVGPRFDRRVCVGAAVGILASIAGIPCGCVSEVCAGVTDQFGAAAATDAR
jgi:hypothetical protein